MKIDKILEIFKDFKRCEQRDILAIIEGYTSIPPISISMNLNDNSILEQLYSYSSLEKENTQFLKSKESKIKPYYLTIMIEDLSASAQKFLYFTLKQIDSITSLCNKLIIGECVKKEIDKGISEKKEADLIREIKSSRFKTLKRKKNLVADVLKKGYRSLAESKEDGEYGITSLKEGKAKSIHVFVNGFTNDKKGNNFKEWIKDSDDLFTNDMNLYGFDWPSGKISSFGKILIKAIIQSKGNWIKGILSTTTAALSEWKQARDNAEEYSIELGKFIKEQYEQNPDIKIYLYGHSLGARLIYFTLENLADLDIEIEEVFFFGGAVHIDDISATDVLRFTKNIYNFYSYNDDILGYMYKVAEIGDEPIGLSEIRYRNSQEKIGNLYNFNVSEFISGHTKYINSFDTLYRRKYRKEEYV